MLIGESALRGEHHLKSELERNLRINSSQFPRFISTSSLSLQLCTNSRDEALTGPQLASGAGITAGPNASRSRTYKQLGCPSINLAILVQL